MTKNMIILVSGPAASGKTTLIKQLSEYFNAYVLKPSEAYFILAKQKNIDISKAFVDIDKDEAEAYYINECLKHNIVIGDQHLAIQYLKDSNLAANNNIDVEEEYVRALDNEFFKKIENVGLDLILVYLKTNVDVLYERALHRLEEEGQALRNKNIEAVMLEAKMEEKFFEEIVKQTNIKNIVIDTSALNKEEVATDVIQKIRKLRRPN